MLPTATFYVMITMFDLRWALIAALCLSYTVCGVRVMGKRKLPGVMLLGAVLITARTGIAFATNNAFLYFLQPSLGNFLLASAFLVSVMKSQPLTRRLADDFCSFPSSLDDHKGLHEFFCKLSLLWAFVCAMNGVGSLLLLFYGSLGNVLLLRPVISHGLIIAGIVISYRWFRKSMGAVGLRVTFGSHTQLPVAAPALV